MRSPLQLASRSVRLVMVAMLGIAAASAVPAAISAESMTAQTPIEEVQELGEIWVRGESLSDVIAEAENEFFRLYNKLNRKNQFDIHCSYLRLNRDSLAMTRTCQPQYLSASGIGGVNNVVWPSCISNWGFVNGSSAGWFARCDQGGTSPVLVMGSTFETTKKYLGSGGPQAEARAQEFIRNFTRIVFRNQQLMETVGALTALYAEMDAIQGSYARVKARSEARERAMHPGTRQAGPRSGPRL